MPRVEFMCMNCGHTFEVIASARELADGPEAECPACGSVDTSRTYDEDTDVEDEDLESGPESDEERPGDLGPGPDEE